ncbi:hypothetical protein ABPG75_003337 [Micractinium tetrahymenae]
MALKASLGVLLGCQFGSASRLLAAAERGDEATVRQVMSDKPFLAAFTGFHGTTSALHRAAAAGHLPACRAILEPLKQRVRDAEAAAAKRGAAVAIAAPSPAAAKWRRLLATVLNQRSHKSLTPLMLACEHGHAGVAAYLLREGADPLATDFAHSRTCLHYAAVGGHADCLRLLCSDSALVAGPDGSSRPLRDVVVPDLQVQACRFIDQRAFGGLTALHFAAVTGCLEAVQALLRAGASIMVKSDGEAYIGEDHLVPGSTPLHVAVIVQSLSIVHAILQAHMEMMNVLGTRLDERGRRPWEGTSRTDIRSVRNQFRKLPFHLARERHHPQLMSLVDPRIPIDVALDAARDTEHGIGPKRLGTICSLVLQRSLLQWLDNCQSQLAREREAGKQRAAAAAASPALSRQPSGLQQALAAVRSRRKAKPQAVPQAALRAGGSRPGSEAATPRADEPLAAAAGAAEAQLGGVSDSPFAALAGYAIDASSPRQRRLPVSASAPTTPACDLAALGQEAAAAAAAAAAGPLTTSAVPLLGADEEGGSLRRMASLHGYMGMLSLKRPQSSRNMFASQRAQAAAALGRAPSSAMRQLSATLAQQLAHISGGSSGSGPQQAARVRFLSEPGVASADQVAMADAQAAAESPGPSSPRELGSMRSGGAGADAPIAEGSAALQQGQQGQGQQTNTITVVPVHRRGSSQGSKSFAMFQQPLFQRLRSGEGTPSSPEALAAAAEGGAVHAAALATTLLGEKHSEKDLALESEGEPGSPSDGSEGDAEDMECGVCLDAAVDVAFASCQHKLCLECARNLTRQDKKPPHCPFCRRLVIGFQRVSATGAVIDRDGSQGRSSSRAQARPQSGSA